MIMADAHFLCIRSIFVLHAVQEAFGVAVQNKSHVIR